MSEDRYTRLKAIKEFGYDFDWEELRSYHVGIIGIGGLGCVSSEIATRCGIGKLTLFDFDTVELVNLNRSMYKPEHVGQPKVEVAYKILKNINPDVDIFYFKNDIMDPNFESIFEKEISKLDIILNGLDNIPAREYLNSKCIRLKIPYIDAGASRSGLSGYVQPIIPYKTPCAKCIKSFPVNLRDERGEPCVASLPSTTNEVCVLVIDPFRSVPESVIAEPVSGPPKPLSTCKKPVKSVSSDASCLLVDVIFINSFQEADITIAENSTAIDLFK